MTENTPTQNETTPESKSTAETKAPAKKRAPRAKAMGLADLTADHLSVPGAKHKDISVSTDNLQAVASVDLGRVLLKIRNFGYIGEGYDVTLTTDQVHELRELADRLDKEAARLIKEAK